jgi:hypothetical protein
MGKGSGGRWRREPLREATPHALGSVDRSTGRGTHTAPGLARYPRGPSAQAAGDPEDAGVMGESPTSGARCDQPASTARARKVRGTRRRSQSARRYKMVYVQAPTRTSWLLLRCSVGSIGRRAGRHHRAGIARVRFAVDEAGPANNGGVDMTAKLITSPGLSPGVMGGPFLAVRGEPEPLGRCLTS